MEKLEPKFEAFTQARPWRVGRIVSGFYVKVESIPGADSRKITFDADGKASFFSLWETAALGKFVNMMQPGEFYRITCKGKEQYKNGKGWAFDVEKSVMTVEISACIAAYAPTFKAEKEEDEAQAKARASAPGSL